MSKTFFGALLIFMLVFSMVSFSYAQTPQETLNQYISDLQKNPNDNLLREKIIKHVQTMEPKPAVPEEAERFMARGSAAIKNAKDINDFKDAVKEFGKAALASPWLASVYYNLGIAQDKAGMYVDAIKSLKLYLLANPNASDAKAVKNLIYEIEYKQEKASKESSPVAIAEKKQNEYESWLKKLDGSRYKVCNEYNLAECYYIEIRGKSVFYKDYYTSEQGPWFIDGRRFEGWNYSCFAPRRQGRAACLFSEDGDRITCNYCEGENPPMVFKRVR